MRRVFPHMPWKGFLPLKHGEKCRALVLRPDDDVDCAGSTPGHAGDILDHAGGTLGRAGGALDRPPTPDSRAPSW